MSDEDKKYIIIAWPKNDINEIMIAHGFDKNDKDIGPMFFKTRGKAYTLISSIQEGWDYMLIEVKGEIDQRLALSSEEFLKLTELED